MNTQLPTLEEFIAQMTANPHVRPQDIEVAVKAYQAVLASKKS